MAIDENLKNKYKKMLEEAKEDLQTPGKRHKQIPNILTASRLLAPLVIIPSALTGNFALTGIIAAGFGLTDLLDGQLARKLNSQSELGEKLDALTDKVFVGTLLLASCIANPFLLANVGLELAIAAVNVKEELNGKHPTSSKIGKIKTWALFALSIGGIIASGLSLNAILPALAVTTGILQTATLASYIKKYSDNNSKEQEITMHNKPLKLEESKEEEEKEKTKTYQKESESLLSKNTLTTEERIEQLKQMREFLQEEKIKDSKEAKETSKDNYQKVKKD